MRESDWRDFCSLIHLADDAAKNTKRDEKTVAFMFEVLMPYEFKGIRRAVIEYIREDKFAVAPSDIIRRIDGTPAEQSLAAWRLFLYTLERYGYYDSVRFPSPAYHFVIKCLGGWGQVFANCPGMMCRGTWPDISRDRTPHMGSGTTSRNR
ncbi:hypothetical protein FACS1894216_11010 [Synergistales bacterium]|nr:hypothetical protein FACS1894216_11010 [Synergistales bacterium]